MVMMLKYGRCDLVLHDLEILAGYARIGGLSVLQDKSLSYAPLDLPTIKTQLYLMVSRSSPFRTELVALLNQGIAHLKKSGTAKKLYEHHVRIQND
ncbi:hypothetical protein [Oligoflexus sp.]|uniref:hypothetical protein n=1 Tax=Oligoflexus sp. TaxID=1971216 RepID=UPI0039C8E724